MQKSPLASRWTGFETSIFTAMSELAREYKAVNLAQGFPDFPGPKKLLDAVANAVESCHNQYSHSSGEEALRIQISEFIRATTGASYDPTTEITITTGATEALYSAINAFVNPGDRVVVFEPFYDSYAQGIINAGGVIVPIRLHAPDTPLGLRANGWAIDWSEFDAVAAGGFKALILNNPHNPTGKVFSEDELERIFAKVLKNDAVVFADEVYEQLVYEPAQFLSACSFSKIRSNLVRISSASKTFGFTGFKVGWVAAPPALTKAVRLVHQAVVFCTNAHVQLGIAEVLKDKTWIDSYLKALKAEYREKRDFLKTALERTGFVVPPCHGAYFLMASFEKLAGDLKDVTFAKQLIETRQVAAIPPSAFYVTPPKSLPWLRFAFCKKKETLEKAASLLLNT